MGERWARKSWRRLPDGGSATLLEALPPSTSHSEKKLNHQLCVEVYILWNAMKIVIFIGSGCQTSNMRQLYSTNSTTTKISLKEKKELRNYKFCVENMGKIGDSIVSARVSSMLWRSKRSVLVKIPFRVTSSDPPPYQIIVFLKTFFPYPTGMTLAGSWRRTRTEGAGVEKWRVAEAAPGRQGMAFGVLGTT